MEPALPVIRWQREDGTAFTFSLSVGRNWLDITHDPPRVLVAAESDVIVPPPEQLWCCTVTNDGKTTLLDEESSPVVEFRHVPNPNMALLSCYEFCFTGISGRFKYYHNAAALRSQETNLESQETIATGTKGRLSQLSTQSLDSSTPRGGVATQMEDGESMEQELDNASDTDETLDPRDSKSLAPVDIIPRKNEESKNSHGRLSGLQVKLLPPIAFDYGEETFENEPFSTQCDSQYETAEANPILHEARNEAIDVEEPDSKPSTIATDDPMEASPDITSANEHNQEACSDPRTDVTRHKRASSAPAPHDPITNDAKDATVQISMQESGIADSSNEDKKESQTSNSANANQTSFNTQSTADEQNSVEPASGVEDKGLNENIEESIDGECSPKLEGVVPGGVTELPQDNCLNENVEQSKADEHSAKLTDPEPSIVVAEPQHNVLNENIDQSMDGECPPELPVLEPASDVPYGAGSNDNIPQSMDEERSPKSENPEPSIVTELPQDSCLNGNTLHSVDNGRSTKPMGPEPSLVAELPRDNGLNADNAKSMDNECSAKPTDSQTESVSDLQSDNCLHSAKSTNEKSTSVLPKDNSSLRASNEDDTKSAADDESSPMSVSNDQQPEEQKECVVGTASNVDICKTSAPDAKLQRLPSKKHDGDTEEEDGEAVGNERPVISKTDPKQSPGMESETKCATGSKRETDLERDKKADAKNDDVGSFRISRTRKRNQMASRNSLGTEASRNSLGTEAIEKTSQDKNESDGQNFMSSTKPPRKKISPNVNCLDDSSDDDSLLNQAGLSAPKRRNMNVKTNAPIAKKQKILSQNSTTNEAIENRQTVKNVAQKRGPVKRHVEHAPDMATPRKTPRRRASARTPSLAAAATVRILVTGVELTAKQLKMVKGLGGEIVTELSSAIHATHVIAADKGSIRRTPKLMIALCRTPNIVSLDWLNKSGSSGSWLPCDPFLILNDRKAERLYEFSMEKTLAILKDNLEAQRYILDGWSVYVCDGVAGNKAPLKDELKCIVEATGAKWVSNLRGCTPTELLILTSEPETETQISKKPVRSVLDKGATKRSIKWFFGATFKQTTDLDDI